MKLSDFDYHLPDELIAQAPTTNRSDSRLMVVHRDTKAIEHRTFGQIKEYINKDDLLVMNDTKVIPARLHGVKYGGEAKIEVLLDKLISPDRWIALARPGKRLQIGSVIEFAPGFYAEVRDKKEDGSVELYFASVNGFESDLSAHGSIPLPPYIYVSSAKDHVDRYQTVYAKNAGATAAPTAGLHFSEQLLAQLQCKKTYVTLHTGYGTFSPVRIEDIREHRMHSERYEISEQAINAIDAVKAEKGRVIAVGTTSARLLESVSGPGTGETDIFIYPGYEFKVVDALITNFHLPKSTLMMLVSAFAGSDLIKRAYKEAVDKSYRFFSFGDAMLIL